MLSLLQLRRLHADRVERRAGARRAIVRRVNAPESPQGELVTRTVAMPKDTNPNGDIFGGWLMSQMDLGSGILASKTAKARVVTVALDGMSFHQPVRVGDTVACYARVESIGRTSMKIPVEVWVQRYMRTEQTLVTHAVFTYVAVDQSGKPIPVMRGGATL
jgi:acyl-CoA thioesterase YciA